MQALGYILIIILIIWLLSLALKVLIVAAVPLYTGFLVGYILAVALALRKIHQMSLKEKFPSLFEKRVIEGVEVLQFREEVLNELHKFPIILTICSLLGVGVAYALSTQTYLPPETPTAKYFLIAAQVVCAAAIPYAIVMLLPRWLFIRYFQMRLRSILEKAETRSDAPPPGEEKSQQKEKSPPPRARSARMTREEAFKVLGLPGNADFSAVQKARKEAIRKFNVDQRQDLEPHIRELVEEKFKQVNMAYDLLKAELQG